MRAQGAHIGQAPRNVHHLVRENNVLELYLADVSSAPRMVLQRARVTNRLAQFLVLVLVTDTAFLLQDSYQ